MSSDIENELAKKISELFFDKIITQKNDVMFELKKYLRGFGIDEIEFLSLKHLVECSCILKGISFKDEFEKTDLLKLFNVKVFEFKKVYDKDFEIKFDKEVVHNSILKVLSGICKGLSNDTDTFSLKFETIKKGGFKYFIYKNKINKYILFYPNLCHDEIFIRRFMTTSPTVETAIPDFALAGKKIITKHSYSNKIPYVEGYFLNELEKLINIIEEHGIEELVTEK